MKILDFVLIAAIIIVFMLGFNSLMNLLPHETISYTPYEGNNSLLPQSGVVQFYPNMRYPDSTITYTIERACSATKAKDIEKALSILSSETVLKFKQTDDGEIHYLCSQIAPNSGQEGHFIAGEGGPVEIKNTTTFSVIFSGQVALYRSEKCDQPNIALHETLHALGFDHVNDPTDIMYPVTDCNKEIKPEMIAAINKLYSYPSEPDLSIDYVTASQSGKFLNFHITLTNRGFTNSSDSVLTLYSDNQKIKSFDLGEIDLATKKFLDVTNLLVEQRIETIEFMVQPADGQEDLFPNNNFAELVLQYAQ